MKSRGNIYLVFALVAMTATIPSEAREADCGGNFMTCGDKATVSTNRPNVSTNRPNLIRAAVAPISEHTKLEKITTLFLTNRVIDKRYVDTVHAEWDQRAFTKELSPKLSVGELQVWVPKQRNDDLMAYERDLRKKNDIENVRVGKLKFLDGTHWFNNLNRLDIHRHVKLFIHGFDNSFSDAGERAAQLTIDGQYHKPVIFFSWPAPEIRDKAGVVSRNPFRINGRYDRGIATAKATGLTLSHALAELHMQKFIVSILAHSMGALATDHALRQIKSYDWLRKFSINAIALLAPDLPVALITKKAKLSDHYKIVRKIRIYCSRSDEAFKHARWRSLLTDHPIRLGDCSNQIHKVHGAETVLVTNGAAPTGHDYYASSLTVIRDVSSALTVGEVAKSIANAPKHNTYRELKMTSHKKTIKDD